MSDAGAAYAKMWKDYDVLVAKLAELEAQLIKRAEEYDEMVNDRDRVVDLLIMAQCTLARLTEHVALTQTIACEGYAHWDADRDCKAGKSLAALGGTSGIRVDLDASRAAVAHASAPEAICATAK